MIAADTSILIAFQQGESGADIALLLEKLAAEEIRLPPAVLTELLSNPRIDRQVYHYVQEIELLDIKEAYWQRAN